MDFILFFIFGKTYVRPSLTKAKPFLLSTKPNFYFLIENPTYLLLYFSFLGKKKNLFEFSLHLIFKLVIKFLNIILLLLSLLVIMMFLNLKMLRILKLISIYTLYPKIFTNNHFGI